MICPDCGKEYQDEDHCVYCGSRPVDARQRKKNISFPEAPVGVYRGGRSRIEIGPESLTIYKRKFLKTYCRTILYRELYAVSFAPAKPLWAGQLCLREWQDRKKPLPDPNGADAVKDATSVVFHKRKNREFERVYRYLETCADILEKTCPWPCLDPDQELFGKYEGPNGFMELCQDSVTFYNKKIFGLTSTCTVPYDQLAEIVFQEAKWYRYGAITVRKKAEGKDMCQALRNAPMDDASFTFETQYNGVMQSILTFMLEQIKNDQAVQ